MPGGRGHRRRRSATRCRPRSTRSGRSTASPAGRAHAERYAQLLDDDGDAVTPRRSVARRVVDRRSRLAGVTFKEGAAGPAPTRSRSTRRRPIVTTSRSATRSGRYRHRHRRRSTISGRSGSATPTVSAAPRRRPGTRSTAQTIFGARRQSRRDRHRAREGADTETVRPTIEDGDPDGTEVVTSDQVSKENAEGVERLHQRLRQRAADLRLHHRLRQRLHHQQRVPDHDRSAPAGAGVDARRSARGQTGPTADHRRVVDHVAHATILGIAGGVGVAKLLIAIFNSGRRRIPVPRRRSCDRARSIVAPSSASASRWRRSSSRPAGRRGFLRSRRCAGTRVRRAEAKRLVAAASSRSSAPCCTWSGCS